MKKILSCCLIAFCCSTVFLPLPVAQAGTLSLSAPSAVLLDGATQQMIYAKSPHARRAPASTTKLLTVMVALDHLPLDREVSIPAGMQYIQPSKIGLYTGERFYVRDLVKAALIRSANDAAESLAILTAGSRAGFAQLMNQKARSLGANNSHFVNHSGLPASGHYSTAYDLALIIMAASRYPFMVSTLKTRGTIIYSLGGRRVPLNNCNKMLWSTDDIIGKTGWTRTAQHCFAGRVEANGRVIFAGLMGDARRAYLWSDLRRIESYSTGRVLKPIVSAPNIPSRKDTLKIQKALLRAGFFKGKATGFFGKRTTAAVRNFQKAKGVEVTGTVGPKTWKKLKTYL